MIKKVAAAISLALLGALLIALLYTSLFRESIEIKKTSPSSLTSFDISLLPKYRTRYFNINDSQYFESKALTLKGSFLILDNTIQRVNFQPGIRGRFQLHFELTVKPETETTLKLYHNGILLSEKSLSAEQSLIFRHNLKLSKTDTITLAVRGQGAIIAGDPVFYKKTPPEKRACIFLICADTLRADRLQTYGYKRNTAPHIDAFAKDSAVFTNAYAQAPWTLPSHMSLFTSLYEFNHGVKRGTMIPDNIDYFIEEISTEHATRSFNGGIYVSSRFGFFRGFDYYQSIPGDQFAPEASKRLFELAIEDLEANPFPKSFYFLHTYQTHSPYNPPLDSLKIFNPSPKYTRLSAPTVGSNHRDQYKTLPPEMTAAYLDLYDAEIFTFDIWFGKFISYLKKKGLYENAMIIFMSDHGEEFFEHSGWGHVHTLYNELIRVPLIIKFPNGQYQGNQVGSEVGLIDIMPLILNHYHISFDEKNIDGKDMIPFIESKAPDRSLFSSLTSGFYIHDLPFKIAAIKNNSKLIYNAPYTDKTFAFFNTPPPPYSQHEFYDLLKDPGETDNIFREKMTEINKHKSLFEQIIQKGMANIKNKGKEAILDKKMIEMLKALGYL
jgi:choline-sulfatase